MPNDVFFETTGIAQFFLAVWIAWRAKLLFSGDSNQKRRRG